MTRNKWIIPALTNHPPIYISLIPKVPASSLKILTTLQVFWVLNHLIGLYDYGHNTQALKFTTDSNRLQLCWGQEKPKQAFHRGRTTPEPCPLNGSLTSQQQRLLPLWWDSVAGRHCPGSQDWRYRPKWWGPAMVWLLAHPDAWKKRKGILMKCCHSLWFQAQSMGKKHRTVYQH